MRTEKALLIASKAFAAEDDWKSWWHLCTTLLVLVGALACVWAVPVWPFRVIPSCIAGLVCVRLFVIYHDYQHHAILQNSPLARIFMAIYGTVVLNPPSVWNRSHDHHHKHNSRSFGVNIGSYPLMTAADFATASRWQQWGYRVSRHPTTILLGYATVFLWGMCLRPFWQNPRRHWDAGCSIFVHFSIMAALAWMGIDVLLFGMLLPLFVASSVGSYLFYAQHNFPAVELHSGAEWSHVEAALRSSSFIRMGRVMNWFTGNIGYHHVHHLNARIPFYRLPEAMESLQELQSPGSTTLRPRDVFACLRLKLWCEDAGRLVGFDGI